ncbi:MAG: nitrate ABC transporter ATP-binding protein [Gammaproteobacteria bacterium RIFCSPHIGHO2_12_FULL_45_9]|nr:MAG: nitrate ABC transporter ATP-binding protein [Gammaproteobacteria bacterium RIFCSPHIGHO2_12_FULL_45_9]
MRKPIIQVKDVQKSFKKTANHALLVLDRVNFAIHEGEIVALLGRSGSGKSTLLRIIAGLVAPSAGEVIFREHAVTHPEPGLTMVFQHFALLPWLTVLENVELGLEARGVSRPERRAKALEAIDIVGLDGFESAYPKELSGGMAQRVGLARALVVDPEVLLMDEPFSALDVLTAENLRSDLIDIWRGDKANIKSVLLVTHNIEEAVSLADRILVFGDNPGHVRQEVQVNLPYPRNSEDARFRARVDEIYSLMTTTALERMPAIPKTRTIGMEYRLPKVQISEILGLLEELASYEGRIRVDLPELAENLHFEINELFPICEALEVLRLAQVSAGDIELTAVGRDIVNADIQERKKLFATQLMQHIPFVRFVREVLDTSPTHEEREKFFLERLESHLSEQAAEEVMTVVIDWGRYAELFAYDYNSGILSLENPE